MCGEPETRHTTVSRMDDRVRQLLINGRELYENHDYFQAELVLEEVVDAGLRFADVFDMLGVIAHTRGDFKRARRMFEQAVELNPNYTDARLNLMVALNELGEYAAARELYESTRKKSEGGTRVDPYARGKIANMHADLSQAYSDVGMPFEAVRELEHAVSLCPDFADLRTRLGVLYRDAGETHRAREQFEAAKQANPKYVRARVLLGALLLSAGNRAAAREELVGALAIDPDEKAARMYLRVMEQQPESQRS